MRIGIIANPNQPRAIELARRALAALEGKAEVVLSPEAKEALRSEATVEPVDQMQADALLAFGGDGTFLRTVGQSAVPLLPINTGTVGFLAEVEGERPGALEEALRRLLDGRYHLEERMKLAGQVDGRGLPDAINEVVVHTNQVAKMRLFEVAIDGVPAGRLRADGMIVATPTGSTSYSLSANGPIVDPGLDALVVSSLAPFQAPARSVVIDPLRTVSIRLTLPGKGAVVVVDGQTEEPVAAGGEVRCYRSARRAVFLRFGQPYFPRLQGKHIMPWPESTVGGTGRDVSDLPPAA